MPKDIKHYGILGMQWGKRTGGNTPSFKYKGKANRKGAEDNLKVLSELTGRKPKTASSKMTDSELYSAIGKQFTKPDIYGNVRLNKTFKKRVSELHPVDKAALVVIGTYGTLVAADFIARIYLRKH